MKKHKLNPKIIRVGDRVKIINPEVFVRCGYPLCKADVKEEIYKHYGKFIEDLVYSVGKGNEFLDRNNTDENLFEDRSSNRHINSKIMDALASVRLVAKKFGGNERKIFTKTYEQIKDKTFFVTGIRFVQTGTYVSGYRGASYFGDSDDSPPYLGDSKTHKILTLDVCRKEIDEDFKETMIHITPSRLSTWKEYELIEIEAPNVEKLPDERELVQDKDGNWIKNEAYADIV